MLIDRLVTTHSHLRGVGSCSALIHLPLSPSPPSLPIAHMYTCTHLISLQYTEIKHKHNKHMVFQPPTAPLGLQVFQPSLCIIALYSSEMGKVHSIQSRTETSVGLSFGRKHTAVHILFSKIN